MGQVTAFACGGRRGTTTGYFRHRRAGEQPCADCREAHNVYNREYKERRRPPTNRTCAGCGVDFASGQPAARFCSRKCKERYREGTAVRRAVVERSNLKRVLRWFAMQPYDEPTGPHLSDIGPLHGPEVPNLDDIGPIHGPAFPKLTHCKLCGQQAFGRKWCDEECRRIGCGHKQPFSVVYLGECRECGEAYCRQHPSDYCSGRCAKRSRRRGERRRRRARKRQARSEPYTLREIAERDGWRCHLCGRKVPDQPYRAKDRDPTIDHLIPVSFGGDDVRSNVALAHNRCNWERSNQGVAQLRLTG